MYTTLRTSPAELPCGLSDVKAHLAINWDHDDALLTSLLAEVVSSLDGPGGNLHRCLVSTGLTTILDAFPKGNAADGIVLPYSMVTSITEIRYLDGVGVSQILSPADYRVAHQSAEDRPAVIMPAFGSRFPSSARHRAAVEVDYDAGWATALAVPDKYKSLIKTMVADRYQTRESIVVGTIQSRHAAFDGLLNSCRYRSL